MFVPSPLRVVFLDFDGVIVESRDIKTWAFGQLFSRPLSLRRRVLDYHERHMGLSRWVKFENIYRRFLRRPLPPSEKKRLGREFSRLVFDRVRRCPSVRGIRRLLKRGRGRVQFFVVSGTPQTELRRLVRSRGLIHFFQGVYGAPRTKTQILGHILIKTRCDPGQAVFVGDAQEDRRAARAVGVRFLGRVPRGERSPFPSSVPTLVDFSNSKVLDL